MRTRNNRLKKWTEIGFIAMGLGLIIFGLLTSLIFQFILIPCTTKDSFIKTAPEFPVYGQYFDIDTTLYQPKLAYNYYGNQRPAVVLVHGFASSKVYFHSLAEELAKRGFVCLTITANGHSASSGAFTLTWENVTLSAVKYLRDYSSALGIDTNRIGLVGHSLGAFSATIAAIMDQEMGNNWINATVGIGGPALNITNSGFYHLISDDYVYPHLWFNLSTALEIAILNGKMNTTRPYNFLNIIGDKDEMFSLKEAYQVVYNSSNTDFWTAYGISNYSMILPGTRYGDFNGTARKLVILTGVDHFLEGSQTETISETVNWFEESMKLKGEGTYPGPLNPSIIVGGIREIILIMAVIGVFISIIVFVKFYGNLLRPKIIFPKNAIEITQRSKWKMILLYSASFIGISFTAFLYINLLSLEDFLSTDFLGANLITLPFLIQGTLMVPVIIVFMWYEKKKFHMTLSDFGLTRSLKSYVKAAIYGILLFLTLYLFLNILSSTGLQNLYIWRIVGFLQVFLYIFLGMITFEILFRGMVQNKFYGRNTPAWKEIIKSGLLSGIVEGFGLSLIILFLLTTVHLDIFPFLIGHSPTLLEAPSFVFSEQLLLIPLIIAIEIIFSILRASIFRKMNRNFLASTLFSALFIAWVLVAFLPSTTLFSFRFVFMT